MATTDNSIVRRGYLNVVRNPKDGMVSESKSVHVIDRDKARRTEPARGRQSRLRVDGVVVVERPSNIARAAL